MNSQTNKKLKTWAALEGRRNFFPFIALSFYSKAFEKFEKLISITAFKHQQASNMLKRDIKHNPTNEEEDQRLLNNVFLLRLSKR